MAVPAVFRKYNEISLIKRILVGLAVGIVLALLIPNVQPWTDIITLLGSLFVGALKAVAPCLCSSWSSVPFATPRAPAP